MIDDIRVLSIIYKLLSRMDRRTQQACLQWLASRLDSDARNAKDERRHTPRHDARLFRAAVGDVAFDLLGLAKITGGSLARRSVEVRGPINADVMVQVKPVRKQHI